MLMRIRAEMANKVGSILLKGIIEADETFIGGKPRKANKKEDREPSPRGRGTSKMSVIGAVERNGQIVAKAIKEVTGRTILDFIRSVVNIKESELMTDEHHGYRQFAEKMKHQVINHQEQYVEGDKHTNTIEGFWSLLKRAYHGSHHHYSVEYTPLYLFERCYIYNGRHLETIFWKFINQSIRLPSKETIYEKAC